MLRRPLTLVLLVGLAAVPAWTAASAAPGDPGLPIELNEPLTPGTSVLDGVVRTSPDGTAVAYTVGPDDNSETSSELWVAELAPGTTTLIDGPLDPALSVHDAKWAGSQRLTWVVEADDGTRRLFSAARDGSDVQLLAPRPADFADGTSVGQFEPTPDGEHVIFTVRLPGDIPELYVMAVDGSDDPLLLSDPVPAGGFIGVIILSADQATVAYESGKDNEREAHAVPLDRSSEPVPLNDPTELHVFLVGIEPTSNRAVFTATEDSGHFQVYSAPLTGGGSTRLNPELVDGGDVGNVELGPGRVVYVADQRTDEQSELFSVPVAGGVVTPLSADLGPGDDVTRAEVSPAGDRVVYAVGSTALHSVPIAGGPSVTLSVPLTAGQQLDFERFTPSGDRVVYNVLDEQFEGITLYAVAVGGGPSQDLGSSASFVTQLSDEVVVYLAGADGRRQVVAAVLAGGEPRVLNDELGPDAGARVDGDGFGDGFLRTDHVWYLADRDVDEVFEIYSVRVGLRCEGELATILGTAGNDSLIGTSARDVIVAGRGDDTVTARGGADLICAGTGADSVAAGGGDDIVRGEAGSDEISGGAGADTIVGGAAADELLGGRGADTILGGRGPDSLDGGRGNDTLDGGPRRDTCAGGAGRADVASNCELTTGVP